MVASRVRPKKWIDGGAHALVPCIPNRSQASFVQPTHACHPCLCTGHCYAPLPSPFVVHEPWAPLPMPLLHTNTRTPLVPHLLE